MISTFFNCLKGVVRVPSPVSVFRVKCPCSSFNSKSQPSLMPHPHPPPSSRLGRPSPRVRHEREVAGAVYAVLRGRATSLQQQEHPSAFVFLCWLSGLCAAAAGAAASPLHWFHPFGTQQRPATPITHPLASQSAQRSLFPRPRHSHPQHLESETLFVLMVATRRIGRVKSFHATTPHTRSSLFPPYRYLLVLCSRYQSRALSSSHFPCRRLFYHRGEP